MKPAVRGAMYVFAREALGCIEAAALTDEGGGGSATKELREHPEILERYLTV